jgi:glycosyltransferase involved in cell wall biosynthesis
LARESISNPPASSHVLFVTQRFSPGYGGIPESLLILANYLDEVGIAADVLCLDGLHCCVGKLRTLPSPKSALRLRDIVHLDLGRYASMFIAGSWNPVALALACRAKRAGVPVVYSAKGNLARAEFKRFRDIKKPLYLMTAELSLLLMADRLVFSSALEQKSLILPPRWFAAKSVVIPESFRGAPLGEVSVGDRTGIVRFGFLAEVAPRKGLHELVAGFLKWCDLAKVPAELHIAGEPRPGSENYLSLAKSMVRNSRHADKIRWLGAVRSTGRDRFYASMDVFICPTRFESFGLTLLEAMWNGLPVIASARMGVLEFLPDDAPVLVLQSLAEGEFAAAFDEVVTNRAAWIERGRRHRGVLIPSLSGSALISRFSAALACRSELAQVR